MSGITKWQIRLPRISIFQSIPFENRWMLLFIQSQTIGGGGGSKLISLLLVEDLK